MMAGMAFLSPASRYGSGSDLENTLADSADGSSNNVNMLESVCSTWHLLTSIAELYNFYMSYPNLSRSCGN